MRAARRLTPVSPVVQVAPPSGAVSFFRRVRPRRADVSVTGYEQVEAASGSKWESPRVGAPGKWRLPALCCTVSFRVPGAVQSQIVAQPRDRPQHLFKRRHRPSMKRATSRAISVTRTVLAMGVCAVCISVVGAQTASTEPPFGEPASFRVDKPTLRTRGASPALIEKLDASPFRYFRLLARQFAARTCFEFRDLRWRLPFVAVHGDAHIEQFVITDHSYGLEDFDQAGFGPSVVDMVRYAASVHVACRQAGWPCDADEAVSAYFDAYRAALDEPVDARSAGDRRSHARRRASGRTRLVAMGRFADAAAAVRRRTGCSG